MRFSLFVTALLLALASCGALFTSFALKNRSDSVIEGMQRIDASLSLMDNKINSIHTGVGIQQELAMSFAENDNKIMELVEQIYDSLGKDLNVE